MRVKNYYQQIITYYPLIMQLKKLSYSLPEIVEILTRDHQFIMDVEKPAQYLSTALSQLKSNKINKKFEYYMILSGVITSSKTEYLEFCAEIEPDCYITHISKSVNKAYIVNEANIHKLGSVRACLITKRILKLHNLSDKQLIHNFILEKNKWNVNGVKYELTVDDKEIINTIHDEIMSIFEKSIKELKLKPTFYMEIFDEKI